MTKKICLFTIPLLAALGIGCSSAANDTTNANTAATQAQATTSPGPDNSEISTSVDASGTRTEIRTFRDNPRIQKVVVTTKDGKRTVKVTSRSGEEKVVDTTENVLEATGDKVADAAGFVADKGEDVAGKTVSTSKTVGKEVGDKAEDVKDKTVSTSKKVGSKTVSGAKKVGSAVKKVIP